MIALHVVESGWRGEMPFRPDARKWGRRFVFGGPQAISVFSERNQEAE